MPTSTSRFLDPVTLAGIRDLKLLARTVVEGFLAGNHLDRHSGVGIEFSQYRGYQPGDDPRRVDWRVYGRSDRYFVRQSEIEREVTVRLLLDVSASMAHQDTAHQDTAHQDTAHQDTAHQDSTHRDSTGKLSKLDYARFLVAALAYLADLQGDRIAFHAISDLEQGVHRGGAEVPLPGRRRLDHLLHHLEQLEAGGKWPAWRELQRRLPPSRGREIVVLISDLYDGPGGEDRTGGEDKTGGDIDAALAAFRAVGHDVLVLQVLGRDELDFSFEGDLIFEDLETGESIRGNAANLRSHYLERLEAELEGWRRRLLQIGVHHRLVAMDQPLDQALREFLLQRRAAA